MMLEKHQGEFEDVPFHHGLVTITSSGYPRFVAISAPSGAER